MQRTSSENGAITAEFAVVFPTVFMVLAIALGSISMQIEKVKLTTLAGMLSRGVSRGESAEFLSQTFASQLLGRNWQSSHREALVCVEVSRTVGLAGVTDFGLRLAEEQCARKLGL